MNNELIEELIDLYQHHDWYYRMSDDNRVYVKGQKTNDRIRRLEQQLDSDIYLPIKSKYKPS